MDEYFLILLMFLLGFAAGSLACYLILARIYKHRRVKDELLKTKRKAVKAQRTLDRFVKTSLDLFSELDEVHRQYATFLKDSIEHISPKELDNFPNINKSVQGNGLFKAFPDISEDISEKNSEKNETLDEIPTPNVLKSPEIPVPNEISQILKQENKEPDEDENQEPMIKL
ncbi:LapA family protein [Succinivibrio sp.]|uniref:LapA family protein n=1 Tax=Succinivibrio sp. TaxID=2053619 RepID=UPI00258BEA8C|nr:LapA family protein [Succinivibrio sp.]MDD6206203.1 LapA family protein [Succinivibrio sp.]